MTRIAVGGFLHETNTFAPTKATFGDFVHGGGWPAMAEGSAVLKTMRNINVGLAGFIEQAERQSVCACHGRCVRAYRQGDG
jgi:microcystin degradation protein MlrC